MNIHQILNGLPISVTNEEQAFIEKYQTNVKISALNEHDTWVARNLVRKGVYNIDSDHNTLVKQ